MAMPTAVNDQITDSVTQSGVSVVGGAPAVAMSALFQASAHSLGLAAQNAAVSLFEPNYVPSSPFQSPSS